MAERKRVAVIGAGVFGRNHLRVVRDSQRAELACVFDLDADKASAAAQEFGTTPAATLYELAAKSDAAIVAVPTSHHKEVACALMEAGLDVLVEKPICNELDEARSLLTTAARLGRVLQVGHLERFNPAVTALHSLITKPLFFEVHRMSVFTPRSLDVSVVGDLMIHDLDIVLAATGTMPEEVRAAGISVLSQKVDIANVRLAFPGGVIANLTASRVSTERVRKLRLFQPGQYISVDYAKQECFAVGVNDGQIGFLPVQVSREEPLKRQFDAFLDCLESRKTPLVDGIAAARALEVAHMILVKIEEHAAIVARSLGTR
jgi:predicted dehydrogenase